MVASPEPADLSALVAEHWPEAGLESLTLALERLGAYEDDARTQALERASVVARLGLDPASVAAALLAPDDAQIDATGLGDDVESLVQGVRRLAQTRWTALDQASAESLRHMFMAMAADVRVVLVLLAHRVGVMRRLRQEPDAERRREIASETLAVFAPLANRLGVAQLKWQLEDLALRELEPKAYDDIGLLLAESRAERQGFVKEVVEILERELAVQGTRAIKISGRPKHIHSIYSKMLRKQIDFEHVYDVSAVRVLVPDVRDCYAVLGVVHGLWAPIAGEFDDYIARPKENMYQSLHTAVYGPGGRPVEIQIRTEDMHEFAEFGVAAHWAYKERRGANIGKKFDVLRQIMQWGEQLDDPRDFAEALETDLFEDQVHVFTPDGKVVSLSRGATPLDFAYRIHTMIGHRCRGARVNGQMVTLQTPLNTGDRVEILTRKNPDPSRDWLSPHLGYVTTKTAKQKIRQWFRRQRRDEAVASGREQLERELARLGHAIGAVDLEAAAEHYDLKTPEDVLAAIGHGDVGAHRIAAAHDARTREERPRSVPPPEPTPGQSASGVSIDGIAGVMSQPARCCRPVPGDPVTGYITRGRGVVIHHRDCPNVRHAPEPERLVDVDWGADRRKRYPVPIEVRVHDQRGALRDVAEVISNSGLDLRSATTHPDPDGTHLIRATVEISTSEDLQRTLARLAALPVVIDARRTRS